MCGTEGFLDLFPEDTRPSVHPFLNSLVNAFNALTVPAAEEEGAAKDGAGYKGEGGASAGDS